MQQFFALESRDGAFVQALHEDSPARRAGVRERDIVLSLDDTPVRDVSHLRVLEAKSNGPTSVEVLRAARRLTVVVDLSSAERRGDGGGSAPLPLRQPDGLGITVSRITRDLAEQLGIDERNEGLVILEVVHGSSADRKRLRVGDVILEVNATRTTSIVDFRNALRANKSAVMLKYTRAGHPPSYAFLER